MSTRRKTLHRRRSRPRRAEGPRLSAFDRAGPGAPSTQPAGPPGPPPPAEVAGEILRALGTGSRHPGLRRTLAALPPSVVRDVARPLIEAMVAEAWAGGWQPAELAWHTRRTAGSDADRVLRAAVAADAAGVATRDVHPAWRAQLSDLDVTPPPSAGKREPGWLHALAAGDPDGGIRAVADLSATIGVLPRLQVLLPVPGRPDIALDAVGADAGAGPEGIEPRVLARVRSLLAKAEATTFEAEAQAFTAKAHELMTRHSLEHAAVARPGTGPRSRPVARRLRLDDPYADAKALLVQVIADASRCRAVSHSGVQMSTVVGFEADVEAVELLFTSLLVQAQTALQELARRAPSGSRERSRGFRSSFLRGFAHRIGDRLDVAGAATVADLDRSRGGALVPVLVAREAEVDDQLAQLFPSLVTRAGSAPVDSLGYRAGSAAAERAELPWERLGPVG